jgi:hypothetical protein
MSSHTTVVTAFYKFGKSKHSEQEYSRWIDNFFSCTTSPVVCFCESTTPFQKYAAANRTFVEIPFHAYDLTTPEWIERWKNEWNRDPEKNIHSWELYAIWALKQEFVHRAINLNAYNSQYFVWCDIGCFREPSNFSKPPRFAEATPSRVSPNRILILKIHEIDSTTHIGGGVLAGDIQAWLGFRTSYLHTLNTFFDRGIFCGKDQTLYRYMIERNLVPFQVIETSGDWGTIPSYKNPKFSSRWFYLTFYLSS